MNFVSTVLLGCLSLLLFLAGFFKLAFLPAILAAVQILNRAAIHFSDPWRKIIHWLHAMAFEGFAFLVSFFSHALRYFTAPVGSKKGRPILLIHGYMNDSAVWLYHKRALKKAGFGPIYAINLGHPFRSIRHYAEKVKEKAAEIAQETGRNDLILIGHSMGGLVSALYAPSGSQVITIASPLKGTMLAKIAIGPNAREMEIGSSLLKEIEEKILADRENCFYHIATQTDQVVIPQESALVILHPERHFILQDIGHQSLLFSKRVSRQLIAWINESKLSLPR